jgi:hypothetical protein
MGLINPIRTTKSQMIKSTTGPNKGRARPQSNFFVATIGAGPEADCHGAIPPSEVEDVRVIV